MKRIVIRILMVSSVALISGVMALAQQRPMGSTQQQPQVPSTPGAANTGANGSTGTLDQMQQRANSQTQDKDFLRKAAEGGMAEVQLGQLAQQKGSSEDVKQFGAKMVQDHTQLSTEMKPIADQMGVSSPTSLSKKDEKALAKLQSLSGTQFDDAYIKMMVKDHDNDLSDFRHEAEYTQNSQLKDAAQQGAQVIDQHLQLIKKIAKAHHAKG